jgi:hypothetical protein
MTTTCARSQSAVRAIVDLPELLRQGIYKVTPKLIKKSVESGTMIELRDWWPQGSANANFIMDLLNKRKSRIKTAIGRRYSTILRGADRVRILVDGEECEPFEHCVWSDKRAVTKRPGGVVPAVFRFDKTLHAQRICMGCEKIIPENESVCPGCGSESMKTMEERVHGWVGIQRFDDLNDFGIDLIRNGRAIRVFEKDAFF